MVCDAWMIIYIVYIQYSILWIFSSSVSDFNCLIHILKISLLKFGLASRPQSDFTLILIIFKNKKCFKIILNLMFYKMIFVLLSGIRDVTYLFIYIE